MEKETLCIAQSPLILRCPPRNKKYLGVLDVPIPFEDDDVKALVASRCGGLMGGANHNIPGFRGETTYRQAYSFTNISNLFDSRFAGTASGSFNEFKYFKNVRLAGIQNFLSATFSSVTVPEGVSDIVGQNFGAFNGCIELPSTVTSIGSYNFWYGTGALTLKLWATTPPSIDCSKNTGVSKIMVPQSALSAYQQHAEWSKYGNIIEGF